MLLHSATAVPLDSPPPSRERLKTAARELEAQFAQMMLKSMRKASLGNAMFGDNTMYRDMYDKQLSQELTRGNGLGLAPMIVRQLERTLPSAPAAPAATLDTGGAIPLTQNLPLAMPLSDDRVAPMHLADTPLAPSANTLALQPASDGVSLGAIAPSTAPAVPLMTPVSDASTTLDASSPEAFVRSIWPHAKRTAEQLGISPKALVAQAALETGWGRRLVGGDGSHNLFGIKATGGWDGARVESATHEYIGGVRHDQRDSFRAYGSIHDSFQDYARLMRNDRYAGALAAGTDADRFARALQRAGYATDPSYAAKISAIVDGPTLNRALADLDESPVRTVARHSDMDQRG